MFHCMVAAKNCPSKLSSPHKVVTGEDGCVAETEERRKAGALKYTLCGQSVCPVNTGKGREREKGEGRRREGEKKTGRGIRERARLEARLPPQVKGQVRTEAA